MISKYDNSVLKYNMSAFMAALGGVSNRHYPKEGFDEFITLGSAISISPLYSMNSNGLDANFSKALSNDFNRLGGKWANRRFWLTVRANLELNPRLR